MSFSDAYISFKGIYIKTHNNVNTTQAFVEILNEYSDPERIDKEEIIFELANRLAHYRKKIGHNYLSSFGNNPKYLEPTIEFDDLPNNVDKWAMNDIK
jgi:hypothetical protein